MEKSLRFEDLTEEQIKVFWNGVGSRHFIIDPHDLIFKEPSKRHDFDYWVGGTDEDRKIADQRFKAACFVEVSKQGKHIRWFYWLTAHVYCAILFPLGKYAFEYGPKATTWEELVKKVEESERNHRKKKWYEFWLK